MAAQAQVQGGAVKPQVAQDDLIQECRQTRIAQPDFAVAGSNSSPSEASSKANGVALAQACGEQATG